MNIHTEERGFSTVASDTVASNKKVTVALHGPRARPSLIFGP
jgi:hypothetical protein